MSSKYECCEICGEEHIPLTEYQGLVLCRECRLTEIDGMDISPDENPEDYEDEPE